MEKATAEKFFQAAQGDEQIRDALKGVKNEDEAAAVAGRFGYEITGEDVRAYVASISDKDMAGVAGGRGIAGPQTQTNPATRTGGILPREMMPDYQPRWDGPIQ